MSRFLHALGISLPGRDVEPTYTAAWTAARAAADASRTSVVQGRDARTPLSGWGHAYYCPEHGIQLRFDERQPTTHRCEPFDHDLVGPAYDAGWATARNALLQTHLASSALAAAVGGDQHDANRAIEIVTGLAEAYPDLPLHGTAVGQGRLTAQSLEEAMVAASLTRSYALVADWMTDQQRDLVLDGLFRPMVTLIRDQLLDRTHNIEVWHLAGLASLAVVLDDAELGRFTLDSEHGIRAQLARGMRPDGWWLEGNPGYHFFMITALLNAIEAHRALGIGDDVGAVMERLLLAPLQTARNDLTVPPFNDGWLMPAIPPGLANYAGAFVRGARLCGSTRVEAFLGSGRAAAFDRAGADFLVYGRSVSAPTAAEPVDRLDVLPDSGYAILRQPGAQTGDGPDTCVYLKYGPHGGGHGHPDKLEVEVMIEGSRVIADPGSEAYTIPIHGTWYRQTWSHPTVVVDQTSQPPATGVLLGHRQVRPDAFGCADAMVTFGPEQADQGVAVLREMVDPRSATTYAGVTIRRMLIMVPPAGDDQGGYLLDLVAVGSGRDQTLDLITHVRGAFDPSGSASARDPALITMPHFEDVRQTSGASRTTYRLTDGGQLWPRLHVISAGSIGAEQLITATTPSNPVHQTCATTVERVIGTRAVFAAVLPLALDAEDWSCAELTRADAGSIVLRRGRRVHRWDLGGFSAAGTPWREPPVTVVAHTLDG